MGGAGSNHDFLEERHHFSLFDEFLLTVPRSDVVASSRTNPARGPSRHATTRQDRGHPPLFLDSHFSRWRSESLSLRQSVSQSACLSVAVMIRRQKGLHSDSRAGQRSPDARACLSGCHLAVCTAGGQAGAQRATWSSGSEFQRPKADTNTT